MMKTLIKPKQLKRGDTIAVISPAGPTPYDAVYGGWDAFSIGSDLLESAGFRTKVFPNASKQTMYLAGTDAERLADLHAAFADPDVDGILCARGGYGCMRLLPNIDFELIARNPKVFIGFSDITALLLPFYQRSGLSGFYGPMLTSNLIHNEPFSLAELLNIVSKPLEIPYRIPNRDAYYCYREGTAEGRLIGGNLSLLAALCGTPYQPHTQGHILFIEDWKEKYYSLDRQFQQLRLAGLLDDIAGLLLCDFSDIEAEPDLELPEFLKTLIYDLQIPMGYGFSVGHGAQTATLPIGCNAKFDAATGTLTLLESLTTS